MTAMNEWALLAQKIDERRIALGLSREELQASTVSETTYRKMARGVPVERPDNRVKICRALGWTPDSIDRILAGGQPELSQPLAEVGSLEHRVAVLESRMQALADELVEGLAAAQRVQVVATAATVALTDQSQKEAQS